MIREGLFVRLKNGRIPGIRRYVTRVLGDKYFEDDGRKSKLQPSTWCLIDVYEESEVQQPLLPHQLRVL